MPTSKLSKHSWKFVFLAIGAFYLLGLGALPLLGPDEPRYAEVAREMLARRDLITPTLGGHPWFEKPSLLYWLMMASYRVLGVNEYAARLGPAVCGLLGAAFVFWLGKSVERANATAESQNVKNLGEWSALVYLSSFGAIAFSRAASFDIVLTMTLTGALSCFFIWQTANTDDRNRPGLLVAFYFFVGLSLLAKGLVGIVLPFGIIAGYFAIRRERPSNSFLLSLLWGVPVALIVAASWYGPMIYRHDGTFIDQFIVQHHFARFLSNKYHHPQPFYFYVPTILWLSAPWTLLFLAGFVRAAGRWREVGRPSVPGSLALVWIIVPFVFFSLSGAKLPGYILPVLPAAALLTGQQIARIAQTQIRTRLVRLTGILFAAATAIGCWYVFHRLGFPMRLAALGCFMGIVAGTFVATMSKWTVAAVLALVLASFTILAIGIPSARDLAARDSVRDLIQAADTRGYAGTPVFYLLCDDRTAEFYAGGRLAYDQNGEPTRFEGAQDVAAAIRQKGGIGLVLMETRWEKQLTDYRAVETERIAENGSTSIFAVRTH